MSRLISRILFIVLFFSVLALVAQDAHDMYKEPFRPQFHYSPPCRWMNDPNGMVYVDGEYHLFYQFHPFSETWGPCTGDMLSRRI